MQADIQLDGDWMRLDGRVVQSSATDFMLDNPERRKLPSGVIKIKGSQWRRAMVHGPGDQLIINYGGDYNGGVVFGGKVGISAEVPDLNATIKDARARIAQLEEQVKLLSRGR